MRIITTIIIMLLQSFCHEIIADDIEQKSNRSIVILQIDSVLNELSKFTTDLNRHQSFCLSNQTIAIINSNGVLNEYDVNEKGLVFSTKKSFFPKKSIGLIKDLSDITFSNRDIVGYYHNEYRNYICQYCKSTSKLEILGLGAGICEDIVVDKTGSLIFSAINAYYSDNSPAVGSIYYYHSWFGNDLKKFYSDTLTSGIHSQAESINKIQLNKKYISFSCLTANKIGLRSFGNQNVSYYLPERKINLNCFYGDDSILVSYEDGSLSVLNLDQNMQSTELETQIFNIQFLECININKCFIIVTQNTVSIYKLLNNALEIQSQICFDNTIVKAKISPDQKKIALLF